MVAALAIVSAAGAARAGDDILTIIPYGTRVPHAVAYAARGRLVVRATDVPGPCGDGPWKAPPPWDAVVTIDLAPGPGGRFFAGAPFGAIAGYAKRSLMEASGLDPSYLRIDLEPFELAPGKHVRGRIAGAQIAGRFDAEICGGGLEALRGLPVEAPAHPATGTLAGKPFEVRRALALVSSQSKSRQVNAIVLYGATGPTCAAYRDAKGPAMVWLSDLGGASTAVPLLGSPQQATARYRAEAGGPTLPEDRSVDAWVRFDELRFDVAKKVRGAMVVKSADADVAGTFAAEVCRFP
ncbi:MAG TPA: hypothetical protein VKE22_17890 [Haliangiales bacterium]|nr:hypothetical protein [Haliangiales bacterium]